MTNNGYSLTKININRSDKDTLSHEVAHDFLGDTTGLASRIAELDKTGIFGQLANAFEDVVNDGMREAMKNPSPSVRATIVAPQIFNSGAKHFQQMLTQQAAIRPRQ
jgi:hypothetical protein